MVAPNTLPQEPFHNHNAAGLNHPGEQARVIDIDQYRQSSVVADMAAVVTGSEAAPHLTIDSRGVAIPTPPDFLGRKTPLTDAIGKVNRFLGLEPLPPLRRPEPRNPVDGVQQRFDAIKNVRGKWH